MRGATRWLVVLGAWWVVSGLLLGSWLGRQRQPDVAAAAPPVDAAPPADAPPVDAPPTDTGLFDAACSGRTCERSRLGLEEPLSVHVWRTGREDAQKGWRFRHLLDQGLAAHPAVDVVDSAHHADVVLWLPQWAAKAPLGLAHADEKLVILDEHDDRERRFGPYAAQRGDAYLAYFKRSFANKSDGAFLGFSEPLFPRYYAMQYVVFQRIARRVPLIGTASRRPTSSTNMHRSRRASSTSSARSASARAATPRARACSSGPGSSRGSDASAASSASSTRPSATSSPRPTLPSCAARASS